ncbi:MAG: 2'-5' RNA ligase family protein [Flavobacteriales bacterium]|nr:2'-5' RNA ligase family protein [Flavobacteriales bacterium]
MSKALNAYDRIGIALVPAYSSDEEKLNTFLGSQSNGGQSWYDSDEASPHITLAMLHLPIAHRKPFFASAEELARQVQVKFTGYSILMREELDTVTWLNTEPSIQLTELHQHSMEIRQQFHDPNAKDDGTSCFQWVSHFIEHAYENWHPHITLGVHKNAPEEIPDSMVMTVRISRLGDRCTFLK